MTPFQWRILQFLADSADWMTRNEIKPVVRQMKGYADAMGAPTRGSIEPNSLEGMGYVEHRKAADGSPIRPLEYRITPAGKRALTSNQSQHHSPQELGAIVSNLDDERYSRQEGSANERKTNADEELLHGDRRRYWRIGTTGGDAKIGSHWEMMRDRNCVGFGFPQLGDLSWVDSSDASREKLKNWFKRKYPRQFQSHRPRPATSIGRSCAQIIRFVVEMAEGDIVLAAHGANVLGIGTVVGGYQYETRFQFPHQRAVKWLNLGEWKMPLFEGRQTTVCEIKDHGNLLEVQRRVQSNSTDVGLERATGDLDEEGYFDPTSAEDERDRIFRELVQRRGQPEFRAKLIAAYRGKCAVTGCDVPDALEAAHILAYRGTRSHHVTNGLLLRADIHTLFDLDLIGIDSASMKIVLASRLRGTRYADLQGRKLTLPSIVTHRPSKGALAQRWQRFAAR